MQNAVLAWHFVGSALRDGRPVPADSEVLRYDGPLVLCESGLHASKRIIDSLKYAPGPIVCRVLCRNISADGNDKFVCSERTILWRMDATEILQRFARMCALDVAHFWGMPKIVFHYLETGEESLRAGAANAVQVAYETSVKEFTKIATDASACAIMNDCSNIAWYASRVAARAADATANAAGPFGEDIAWADSITLQNERLTKMIIAAAHGSYYGIADEKIEEKRQEAFAFACSSERYQKE